MARPRPPAWAAPLAALKKQGSTRVGAAPSKSIPEEADWRAGVRPLTFPPRVEPERPRPAPVPRQKLADERKDICGMTLLASRAVATPFVGALAAVLALAEVMRPLHGGLVYAALDVQMRALRHRTGAAPSTYQGLRTAFVQAEKRPVSSTREAA